MLPDSYGFFFFLSQGLLDVDMERWRKKIVPETNGIQNTHLKMLPQIGKFIQAE